MDTTTQEPRRLRPAAGRGASPTPRRPPQAGAGRPELVQAAARPSGPRGSRAGVDHGGNGRARGGAPPGTRGANNGDASNGGGNNRGGNARGSDGGGRNSGGGNSRRASSRAVNSGRVNGAGAGRNGNRAGVRSSGPAVAGRTGTAVVDTGPGNGGRRHLRVVGQPAVRVGPGQSATGAAARGRTGSVSAGPAAPQAQPSVAREAGPAAGVPLPRIPFVLLVLALLGGGLICLLVVNTTLGATSFRISQLQRDNAKLSLQEQTLLDQVAKEQSPQGIEQRAYQLGMRTPATSNILDLRNHRFAKVPDHPGAQGQDSTSAPPARSTPAAGRRSTRHHVAAHHKRTASRTGSTR